MSQNGGPNIFEYGNYREYLKALYSYLKETKPQFSFRFFSRMAGFSSPNFLKLVMDGKRNLSAESIDKFAQALKLGKAETAFFRNLVLMNQAESSEERQVYAAQLMRSREYRKFYPLKEAELHYYSRWYFVPIREMVNLPTFKEDPEWVARQLVPAIGPAEARKALDELEKLGLLRRDGEGRLVQATSVVSTSDEISSAFVAQFHREMLKKASESIDRIPATEREISAATIGVSAKAARGIKKAIQRFRQEILEIAAQDEGAQRVYQVNFQFFPLMVRAAEAPAPAKGPVKESDEEEESAA